MRLCTRVSRRRMCVWRARAHNIASVDAHNKLLFGRNHLTRADTRKSATSHFRSRPIEFWIQIARGGGEMRLTCAQNIDRAVRARRRLWLNNCINNYSRVDARAFWNRISINNTANKKNDNISIFIHFLRCTDLSETPLFRFIICKCPCVWNRCFTVARKRGAHAHCCYYNFKRDLHNYWRKINTTRHPAITLCITSVNK